jgi:antitoxin component of MazEF toxin-antitoxin module
MREFYSKTRKIGDSIAIVLPRDVLEAEQIKENMDVKVTVQKSKGGLAKPAQANPSGDDDPWRLLE